MKLLLFILAFLSLEAGATLVRVPFEGVRPTGMGNAFIGISDDANALFYNPAGLANVTGTHFNLVDIKLGADNGDTFTRVQKAMSGDYAQLLHDSTEFINLGIMPTLTLPYFSISVYDNGQGFFDVRNLETQDATVDVDSANDLGLIVGGALPLGENASFGISVRGIERTAIDAHLTAQDVLGEVPGGQASDIRTALTSRLKKMAGTGWGVGLNVGAMYRVPMAGKSAPRWTLAATVEDVGNTSFHGLGGSSAPPPLRQSYNLGTALKYPLGPRSEVNIALDLRDEFQGLPFVKTLHFGAEFRHKVFGVRAGIYQGYPTAGFSLEFPPHTRLHVSTYEVELGDTGWQRGQRWYLLQLVIGFNPL